MKPFLLAALLGATLSLPALAEDVPAQAPATVEAAAKTAPRTATVISGTKAVPGALFGKIIVAVEWNSHKEAAAHLEKLIEQSGEAVIFRPDVHTGYFAYKVSTLYEGEPGNYLVGNDTDEAKEASQRVRNIMSGIGEVAMMLATGGRGPTIASYGPQGVGIKREQLRDLAPGAKQILVSRISSANGHWDAVTVSYDDIDEDTLARINVEQGLARILKLKLPETTSTN